MVGILGKTGRAALAVVGEKPPLLGRAKTAVALVAQPHRLPVVEWGPTAARVLGSVAQIVVAGGAVAGAGTAVGGCDGGLDSRSFGLSFYYADPTLQIQADEGHLVMAPDDNIPVEFDGLVTGECGQPITLSITSTDTFLDALPKCPDQPSDQPYDCLERAEIIAYAEYPSTMFATKHSGEPSWDTCVSLVSFGYYCELTEATHDPASGVFSWTPQHAWSGRVLFGERFYGKGVCVQLDGSKESCPVQWTSRHTRLIRFEITCPQSDSQ